MKTFFVCGFLCALSFFYHAAAARADQQFICGTNNPAVYFTDNAKVSCGTEEQTKNGVTTRVPVSRDIVTNSKEDQEAGKNQERLCTYQGVCVAQTDATVQYIQNKTGKKLDDLTDNEIKNELIRGQTERLSGAAMDLIPMSVSCFHTAVRGSPTPCPKISRCVNSGARTSFYMGIHEWDSRPLAHAGEENPQFDPQKDTDGFRIQQNDDGTFQGTPDKTTRKGVK